MKVTAKQEIGCSERLLTRRYGLLELSEEENEETRVLDIRNYKREKDKQFKNPKDIMFRSIFSFTGHILEIKERF